MKPSITTDLLIAQGSDWIAINKPSGLSMHSEEETGLVVQASNAFNRPLWPVHRLDKVTSGILLLATSKEGAARLGELFAKQEINKWYLAQSSLKPKKKQGWVKGDMAKGRNGSWLLKRSMSTPAITYFVSHFDEDAQQRIFLLQPKTGKTHQLRVAMKSLGSAIDGDSRYAGTSADRTYLHAYALSWSDSAVNETVNLLCSPNKGTWAQVPQNWQTPWLG